MDMTLFEKDGKPYTRLKISIKNFGKYKTYIRLKWGVDTEKPSKKNSRYIYFEVDGEISYFFSKTTDKGEIIGHIPKEDCYIKCDEESKPHIEVHQTTHEFPSWIKKVFWVKFLNSTNTEYYVIFVPEGTISVDGTYQIDME